MSTQRDLSCMADCRVIWRVKPPSPMGENSMALTAPGNEWDTGLTNLAQKLPSILGPSVNARDIRSA